MITTDNIVAHELIGMDVEITDSSNPQIIGLNGRIVDETKSMIKIDTANGRKAIAKVNSNWKFSINGKSIVINGSKIAKRPFDRLGEKKW